MKLLFILFTAYCSLTTLYAQVGFGVGLEPGDWSNRTTRIRQKKRLDPYAIEISSYFQVDAEEITKLFSEGLGRKETIKLVILSKKSNQPLSEIVKLRKKKTTFAELAKRYTLDYSTIKEEADEVFRKIKYAVAVSTYTIHQSTSSGEVNK